MICSIIIRSYNEERHIGRLLKGINSLHLPENVSLEVIVVDSGSTDATVAIAEKRGAKIVSIHPSEFSFGRALNRGCAAAKGDILVFASAHVYPVFTDWITKLMQPFENHAIALVYGKQIGNHQTKFSEHQVFKKWFPAQSNYNQSTPFCNNANCAIRKSLWQAQCFDETLTGLEDLDWAQKIMKNRYQIAYEANAPIVHVHEETAQKIENRYQREAIAFKQIFPKIQFGYWDFIKMFTGNSLSDFLVALKQRKLKKQFKNIVIFRYMQFYGTYLGHRQKGELTKELRSRFYYPNKIASREKENILLRNQHKIIYHNEEL